jgi:anti-sigma factor RsiW
MRCAWVQERLLLYLARELGAQEAEQIRAHLQKCAVCAGQAEEFTKLQESVDSVLQTQAEAPARLEARVMEAVRALPAPRSSWLVRLFLPERRPRLVLAAGALSLLLMVGLAVLRFQYYETALPLDMVLLSEAHSVTGQRPPQVPGSVPEELAQALSGRVQFPIAVADLHKEGAKLLGGSRTVVQGAPVAQLQYEYQGERISLFEMDAAKLAPPLPKSASFPSDSYFVAKREGVAYVAWRNGKTNCVMVARSVPMHLLFHLACRACEQQDRPKKDEG